MNKTLKVILLVLAVIVVALGSFAGGFVTGHIVPFAGIPGLAEPTVSAPPTTTADQQSATPSELQTLFAPFWEAWTLVHQNFVDQPLDDVALMRGAISGMMQALGDKHSTYMDPQNFADANASLDGSYEGIGAYVDTTTTFLTVISPIPGSPAERAGIQTGDQVVAIDGKDMTGITAEAARLKVLGPAGTTVHLSILREGEADLLEFDIVREKIVIASASGKMLESDIAYIQVTTFGANTTPELLATLNDLMAKNPKGIILDLQQLPEERRRIAYSPNIAQGAMGGSSNRGRTRGLRPLDIHKERDTPQSFPRTVVPSHSYHPLLCSWDSPQSLE